MRQDIDKLCTECASLIDNHDKIKDLSAVHYNLGKTLQDVENIVALPQQAAEAEDMLKDDTQLSEVLSMTQQQALLLGHVKRVCMRGLTFWRLLRLLQAAASESQAHERQHLVSARYI